MSNKVDKLFKDKLEGHSLQPSAQAWEKVEAHLGKKNKMVVWLRVAAAVALLGLLTFVGLNWNGEAKQELAKKEEPKQVPVVKQEEPKEAIKETKKLVVPKRKTAPVIEKTEAEISNTEVSDVQVAVAVADTQPPSHPATQQPKGIKLTYSLPAKTEGRTVTYTLPTVNKEEPVVATVEEPKKTGLERVLEIAREVKNGDPMADLREAKDNILAFEFRKDKNKKQH